MPDKLDLEKIYHEIIAMKEVQIYMLSKELDRITQELRKLKEDTAIKEE